MKMRISVKKFLSQMNVNLDTIVLFAPLPVKTNIQSVNYKLFA